MGLIVETKVGFVENCLSMLVNYILVGKLPKIQVNYCKFC